MKTALTCLLVLVTWGSCKNSEKKLLECPCHETGRYNLCYENGKLYTGRCGVFANNGQLHSLKEYSSGKANGTWVDFYSNGDTLQVLEFKSGKMHGRGIEYWENHVRKNEYFYKDDTIEGLYRSWYESSIPKAQGYYSRGEKVGEWDYFDSEGHSVEAPE